MTGNLDEKTSDLVFEFFLEKIKSNNQTLIYVTHNKNYAKKANKIYEISNQKLLKFYEISFYTFKNSIFLFIS